MYKSKKQGSFAVPAAAGSYAADRPLTFGAVAAGQPEDGLIGITVSVDTSIATMSVELWLPKVNASGGTLVDGDYKYSGKSIGATGSETWAFAGYPGAQIRVKSGGTAGTAVLSASVF